MQYITKRKKYYLEENNMINYKKPFKKIVN